jgi:hypothetical protein
MSKFESDLYDFSDVDRIEIHPHYVKLYVLCVIFAVLAALCVRGAMSVTGNGATGLLVAMAVGLTLATAAIWRRARSGLPVVVITAKGIDDIRYGFIPWSQIQRWKHSRSMLNPGFGWSLKDGVDPPRNARIFRIAAALNWFGGVGQRTYRRKMVLGGIEPVAAAFRQFHPEAEAK